MKLYEGEIVPEVRGPEGRAVELHHTDDPADAVASVLHRLCGEEEAPPPPPAGRGNPLVPRPRKVTCREDAWRRLAGDRRTRKARQAVYFSSIRAFKGLESPVVVLCELEDIDDMTIDQQLYVAISRARNHCVIIAPPAA